MPNSPRALCVLIVDDCPDTTDTMAQLIDLWGHQAHRAHSGEEALSRAAACRPDANQFIVRGGHSACPSLNFTCIFPADTCVPVSCVELLESPACNIPGCDFSSAASIDLTE